MHTARAPTLLIAALLSMLIAALSLAPSLNEARAQPPLPTVQTQASNICNPCTSLAVTLSSGLANGEEIVVLADSGNSISISDSLSDSYVSISHPATAFWTWYAIISGYSSGSITVTITVSSTWAAISALVVSNVAPTSPLSVSASSTGTTSTSVQLSSPVQAVQYAFVLSMSYVTTTSAATFTSGPNFGSVTSHSPTTSNPYNYINYEYSTSWPLSSPSTTGLMTSSVAPSSWAVVVIVWPAPGTYFSLNVYQEGAPTSLNTNNLTILIGSNSGTTIAYSLNVQGEPFYSPGASSTTFISVSTSTGQARLYQYPKLTSSTGDGVTLESYSVYFPNNLNLIQSYTMTFYQYNTSAVISIFAPGNLMVWNSSLPSSGSIGVPLNFGVEYVVNATIGGKTESYTMIASTQPTVGFVPIQNPKAYGTPTFTAVWNPSTGQLVLTYSSPNGITGTGTYKVYNSAYGILASGSISGPLPWSTSISGLSYSEGMLAYFSVTDPIQGAVSGYQSVVNSTYTAPNVISFASFPNIGLSNMVAPGIGITVGNFASIAFLLIVASLFSQKHQDIGAIVLAVLGGLFTFWGWYTGSPTSGVVALGTTTALTTTFAVFLFIRKGSNPYNSMEEL